jgi:hypothetical protein
VPTSTLDDSAACRRDCAGAIAVETKNAASRRSVKDVVRRGAGIPAKFWAFVYPPPYPCVCGMFELAGKCEMVYGAQPVAGKIL